MAAEENAITLVKPEAPTPMVLLQMAMSQNADLDKLTKLMELQERWEANQARKAFNLAMAKFKENPPKIVKNKHVEFKEVKYNHATLDHITDAITSALSAVGIGHKYTVAQNGLLITVTCVMTHEMGHSESTSLTGAADTSGSKNSIQAIGSTVTYLQRYTLLAACGLAAGEDTDGVVLSDEVKELIAAMRQTDNPDDLKAAYLKALKTAQTNIEKAEVMTVKDELQKVFNARD